MRHALAAMFFAASAQATPALVLSHTGRVLDEVDEPLTGQVTLKFELHTAPAPGGVDQVVWDDEYSQVTLDARGTYALLLGDTSTAGGTGHHALTPDKFAEDRWLALTVNGQALTPWLRFGAMPYAGLAGEARALTSAGLAELDARYATFDAAAVTTGTLADARLSANVDLLDHAQTATAIKTFSDARGKFSGNGAGLTGLDADAVEIGTLDDARLSANVDLLDQAQAVTGMKTFSDARGTFSGNGAGLTALNGSAVATGTVADARLTANVDLLDAAQTVGGAKTFTSAQNAFTGSGAGLTALNGTAVAAGTVADARLTANVALLGRTPQAFAGINTFAGAVGIGTATPAAGALLDLTSTTQAFLPPRMTKAQRDAIPGANLVAGMVLFNTDDGALNIYNGTAWTNDVRGGPAYIKLGMSNYQGPSYICNCTVATGHTISFDTLRYKSKLTNSSNGINLKAGHTYRLEASVSLYVASGNQYLGYRFYNATAAAEFGEGCYTGLSASSAAQYGFKPQCLEIYTPSADVNIQVRVNDGNIGTAGLISPNYNTYFMATEM